MTATTVTWSTDYSSVDDWFTCPRCKRGGIFDWFQFCPYCGTELDWSEVEDEDEETNRHTS